VLHTWGQQLVQHWVLVAGCWKLLVIGAQRGPTRGAGIGK
jgi:hypothetical protein